MKEKHPDEIRFEAEVKEMAGHELPVLRSPRREVTETYEPSEGYNEEGAE